MNGSSIAMGHPFAATGARILAVAAKLFEELPQARRGLISVCTAGGMGVTAIVERRRREHGLMGEFTRLMARDGHEFDAWLAPASGRRRAARWWCCRRSSASIRISAP